MMRKLPRFALIAAGLLLAAILIGPFLVPIPPLEHTLPPEELADPDSRFTEVDDLQVHYKATGEGRPAFILLHGFGASVFSWREVIDPLGAIGTVVAFDRPAFGLTERPLAWEEGSNPYTPQAQVALVVELMDTLGIEDAVLVGNSAGGTVAVQTLLAHPERVQALVLVDAAIYEGGGTPGWIRPLLKTPQMDRLGPLLARQISRQGDAFLESAWHDPSKITPQIREGYREPLRAQHWDRALWELTKASRRRDLADQIGDLAVPSLVISGDDDRIVPVESSIRLAEQLPNAELVIIPNCGHLPQEECPQPFLEAVTNFLDTNTLVSEN
jgi:pimeloyl-ACP methyl ester carboxylesterase